MPLIPPAPGLPSGAAPPGVPPAPMAPPPTAAPPGMGDPAMGDPSMGGAPPFPSTDPNAVMGVLEAMKMQDLQAFAASQDAAIGQGVAQMMQTMPNQAGMEATSLPGSPVPPPMPGGDGGDPMAGASY